MERMGDGVIFRRVQCVCLSVSNPRVGKIGNACVDSEGCEGIVMRLLKWRNGGMKGLFVDLL